jgi:hypothetical protein
VLFKATVPVGAVLTSTTGGTGVVLCAGRTVLSIASWRIAALAAVNFVLCGLEVEEHKFPSVGFWSGRPHVTQVLTDEIILAALALPFVTSVVFFGSVKSVDYFVA